MAHACDDHHVRALDGIGQILTGADRHQRFFLAMDHECRGGDAGEMLDTAISAGDAGEQMPGRARWIEGAIIEHRCLGLQRFLIPRETG